VLYASNRAGSFDIYMLMLSTMKLYQLTQGIGNAFAPVFSPEENAIYFINRPAENPPALWRMESTGKDPRSLYSGTGAIVGMDLSPDGTRIALVMGDDQTGNYGIYLFDPAAKILVSENLAQNMTGITGSLDWSPDGKYLLFCAGILGDKDIFRLELTTGSIVQLTNGGNNAAAVYSPDGLLIAFNSLRNQDQADIFVMKSDGTYQRQLTTNPEPDWQPQWEP
jgi:Tol biopolymer transport system component